MNKEISYKNVLDAIIAATIEHHATVVIEPGAFGYEFDVLLLGYHCHVDSRDPVTAAKQVTNFINKTLAEVDG
jgi:hypothetical protein